MIDRLSIRDFVWSYPAPPHFRLEIRSLEIRPNCAVYLHGPSGCGKSTLLNLLGGTLDNPLIAARDEVFHSLCYIMHESTLAPWLRLGQNIRLEERLRATAIDRGLLAELLRKFGLNWQALADTFPRSLSLGMRQRFEIAKSLAFRPGLLLMDEAFSGIDGATRDLVATEVGVQLRECGSTAVFTSHNLIDGLRLADCVVHVRDGRVSECQEIPTERARRASLSGEALLRSAEAAMLI